jgi:hypothetical protein
MTSIELEIDQLMSKVMAQISEAASKQDLSSLESLTRRATELREMKEQVSAIANRLKAIAQAADNKPGILQANRGQRELLIRVTQGMIGQNLLTLTEHINRGRIKIGEILTVKTLPDGGKFTTEVLASGNKLQERGAIGKFYRKTGVRDGDYVVLSEISSGQWQLRKAVPTEVPESDLVNRYIRI